MSTGILIIISTLLVLISPVVYIHSILYGKTRPHRTTRFVVLVITVFSTLSLVDNHFGAAFWLAAASAAQALAVFALSVSKGIGGWSHLDITCLVIAGAGIVLWQTTDRPIVGLYASILADFIGYVPAFVKTYKWPDTENWPFFAMDTLAAVFSLVATPVLTAYTLGYPIYIFVANAGMVALILARRRQQRPSDILPA